MQITQPRALVALCSMMRNSCTCEPQVWLQAQLDNVIAKLATWWHFISNCVLCILLLCCLTPGCPYAFGQKGCQTQTPASRTVWMPYGSFNTKLKLKPRRVDCSLLILCRAGWPQAYCGKVMDYQTQAFYEDTDQINTFHVFKCKTYVNVRGADTSRPARKVAVAAAAAAAAAAVPIPDEGFAPLAACCWFSASQLLVEERSCGTMSRMLHTGGRRSARVMPEPVSRRAAWMTAAGPSMQLLANSKGLGELNGMHQN
jgi:hypothetical protein